MGEESAIETMHRYDDDHRPTMNEANQQNPSGPDDRIKRQHSDQPTPVDQTKQIADKKNDNNGHNANSNDNGNSKRPKTVCYDFKKGFCRRRFCRYPHVMNVDQVIFCHDYQNTGCFRQNCRFIHRNIEEEEHYRQFGVFPLPPERPVVSLQQMAPEQQIPPPPAQSFYQPHVVHNDEMVTAAQTQPQPQPQPQPQQQQQQQQQHPQFQQTVCQSQQAAPLKRRSYGLAELNHNTVEISKRSRPDDVPCWTQVTVSRNEPQQPPQQQQPRRITYEQSMAVPATSAVSMPAPPVGATASPVTSVVIGEDVINIYRLYEEHNLLRRRVEINEERLQELRATNTYLLHQNEQLRRQSQCSCTSTIVNPVTLTTASQQSAPQQQVINAVSIAPVQMQATPIVSIASIAQPQTQIISSTPLAIATNTSQGQQLALASTQQAAHAGQILGTSQITLAAAPSMGITMNTSQPLAMSANATQPIISYPVMTHSILPH